MLMEVHPKKVAFNCFFDPVNFSTCALLRELLWCQQYMWCSLYPSTFQLRVSHVLLGQCRHNTYRESWCDNQPADWHFNLCVYNSPYQLQHWEPSSTWQLAPSNYFSLQIWTWQKGWGVWENSGKKLQERGEKVKFSARMAPPMKAKKWNRG